MKIIVFIILSYFAYRTFIRPLYLSATGQDQEKPKEVIDESDYIDYEEVD